MDTRDRNAKFNMNSAHDHLIDYSLAFLTALQKVDKENLIKAADQLSLARQLGRRIFAAGNGGSAAIASHLNCDFIKGCHYGNTLNVQCLTDNVPLVTAIANDISYDEIFSKQLEFAVPHPGEVLVLISSSGNSKNVVRAAIYAREAGMTVIGMTGFNGGELKKLSHVPLHIPCHNYGVVEDAHMAIIHSLAQFHYRSVVETPS